MRDEYFDMFIIGFVLTGLIVVGVIFRYLWGL